MTILNENFWLAISFIIFMYLAYRPVKKAILSSLDSKISEIQMRVLEAEALKKDAELMLKRTEEEIAHLGVMRDKIINEAKGAAAILVNERTKTMELLLERKQSESINFINHKKSQACSNIQSEFAEVVTKLVSEYFRSSKNDSLSDQEIAKLFLDSSDKK